MKYSMLTMALAALTGDPPLERLEQLSEKRDLPAGNVAAWLLGNDEALAAVPDVIRVKLEEVLWDFPSAQIEANFPKSKEAQAKWARILQWIPFIPLKDDSTRPFNSGQFPSYSKFSSAHNPTRSHWSFVYAWANDPRTMDVLSGKFEPDFDFQARSVGKSQPYWQRVIADDLLRAIHLGVLKIPRSMRFQVLERFHQWTVDEDRRSQPTAYLMVDYLGLVKAIDALPIREVIELARYCEKACRKLGSLRAPLPDFADATWQQVAWMEGVLDSIPIGSWLDDYERVATSEPVVSAAICRAHKNRGMFNEAPHANFGDRMCVQSLLEKRITYTVAHRCEGYGLPELSEFKSHLSRPLVWS